MFKSCSICGGLHKVGEQCPQKRKKPAKKSEADKFRSSGAWQITREEIKRRDMYLCRVCAEESELHKDKFNSRDLSVHHIVPIEEDFEIRLDEGNLITLCRKHHEEAEKGIISREFLKKVLKKHPPYF